MATQLHAVLSKELGLAKRVAMALGIAPAWLSQMALGLRPVPHRLAPGIERELQGQVRRWDLCPDDWHLVWPELVGTEGAPDVPLAEAKAG